MLSWKPRENLSRKQHPQYQPDKTDDIVDTMAAIENFSIFTDLIKAGGLVETLRRPGPFTVFAPVNQAFSTLRSGALEAYFDPRNHESLVALVTHHITVGVFPLESLRGKLLTIATLFGDILSIDGKETSIVVDTGIIAYGDIGATNGQIHALDAISKPTIGS